MISSGGTPGRIDIFDKQHGTFKQFVSENAAGSDLMIHCQKLTGNNDMKMEWKSGTSRRNYEYESIIRFIEDSVEAIPIVPFLHVQRKREVDYRTLYSMYVSAGLHAGRKIYGFERFRLDAKRILEEESTVDTLRVFTGSQKRRAKVLLAGKVASMMGRKLEESDWSEIYCKAKNIPVKGWSNLNIDVEHEGLGVELKMLRVRVDRGKSIEKFCGKTLMHPSMTRSIRIDSIERPAQKVMEDVFEQYAALIEDRTERVRKESRDGKADMRFGWLLWESSLTEFLYFEERMRAPNSNQFFAEWHVTPARGSRKESKSLWVYEKGTGKKRYSITTSAGIRIQPYFDVPHWGDSELVHFRVQSEYIGTDTVLLWVAGSTAKQLEKKLGTMRKEVISDSINELAGDHEEVYDSIDRELTRGVAIAVSEEAFGKLMGSGNAVSDEHGVQLLLRALE